MTSSYTGGLLSTSKTSAVILIGLGLGIAGLNLKEKIIKHIRNFTSKKPAEDYRKRLENLSDKELAQEFKKVLSCYSKEFDDSKILERIVEKQVDDQT